LGPIKTEQLKQVLHTPYREQKQEEKSAQTSGNE